MIGQANRVMPKPGEHDDAEPTRSCWRPGSARACGRTTAAFPKPLVAIGGKSLIDYGLDRLADAGVSAPW